MSNAVSWILWASKEPNFQIKVYGKRSVANQSGAINLKTENFLEFGINVESNKMCACPKLEQFKC